VLFQKQSSAPPLLFWRDSSGFQFHPPSVRSIFYLILVFLFSPISLHCSSTGGIRSAIGVVAPPIPSLWKNHTSSCNPQNHFRTLIGFLPIPCDFFFKCKSSCFFPSCFPFKDSPLFCLIPPTKPSNFFLMWAFDCSNQLL